MIDLVHEGFDLAVAPGPQLDSTLIKRQLTSFRYLVCASPAYLKKHRAPRPPSDLADHNCLLYAYSSFGRERPFVNKAGKTTTVRVSGNLVTTSIPTMRAAAVAGVGL